MSFHNTIIFSIDNPTPARLIEFHDWCEWQGLSGGLILPVIGCYNGVEEPAFIMEEETFGNHIADSTWIMLQESILRVSGCNKMYADLYYRADGPNAKMPMEHLGSMCQVSEEVARKRDAWTYRPDMNAWFITDKSNPDHSGELS